MTGAGEQGGAEDGTSDEETTVVRGDRFSGGPARSFLSSLAADKRIFDADLAVDRAHVIMLTEQDILSKSNATEILNALQEIETAGHDALPAGEDVHEAIESAVIDRVGPVGGRMHTARSRNDEVAACIRFRFRTDLLNSAEATLDLRETLLETTSAEIETLLPGFTHGQYAQPVTVAHLLASYAGAVARDTARLLDAFDRTNRSPLGAAAFAGTPFDINRSRVADLLGFDGVVENSTDAVSARDFLVEGCAALAAQANTCSGLATDLIGFTTDGHLVLDDAYASTSSIMPQKKNPDSLELVRATTGDAVGSLMGVLTSLKGLPRAYNRDFQRVTPMAWDAVDAVTEATEVVAGAVATGVWDPDKCRADASRGFSTATGVADVLAMAGVPFRTAHEIVARAAETTPADALDDPEALVASLETVADDALDVPLFDIIDESVIEDALDPARSVDSRDSRGGPAPSAIEDALVRMETRYEDHRAAVADRVDSLTEARDTLNKEVSAYV